MTASLPDTADESPFVGAVGTTKSLDIRNLRSGRRLSGAMACPRPEA